MWTSIFLFCSAQTGTVTIQAWALRPTAWVEEATSQAAYHCHLRRTATPTARCPPTPAVTNSKSTPSSHPGLAGLEWRRRRRRELRRRRPRRLRRLRRGRLRRLTVGTAVGRAGRWPRPAGTGWPRCPRRQLVARGRQEACNTIQSLSKVSKTSSLFLLTIGQTEKNPFTQTFYNFAFPFKVGSNFHQYGGIFWQFVN